MADVQKPCGDRRKLSLGKWIALISLALTFTGMIVGGFWSLNAQIVTQAEKRVEERKNLERADAEESLRRQALETLIMSKLTDIAVTLDKLERKIDRAGRDIK